jgi:ParB family chromosome partitioning protein
VNADFRTVTRLPLEQLWRGSASEMGTRRCALTRPTSSGRTSRRSAPSLAPAPEAETHEEAAERQRNYEHQRKDYEQEQERKAEERKQQFEREQKEHEAECARREKLHEARVSKFDRIIDKPPAMFSAAQLRVFLRALVNIDPYTFNDVAEYLAANNENNEQSSEEILLSTIDGLPDDKLTGIALRLVFTGHTAIPRESEIGFLTEAEAAFAPPQPKKTASKKAMTPTSIKGRSSKAVIRSPISG